jgi:putative hydrolase of the HAD superfamily
MDSAKRAIRAVTFDLWETLLFESDGASARRADARCRNLAQALNSLGVQVSLEEMSAAVNETVSSLITIWGTNRDVAYIDQIRLIIKKATRHSLELKQEWTNELIPAYTSNVLEVPPYLNPEARKALKGLKKRNKLIGLICNTGLTPGIGLREFLANESVSRYFDLMIFSEEIGIRKPDPRIFHLAAQRLGVQPCEIVHVGDNLKADVWGAKNAGLKAIHFSSLEGRDKIAESDPNSLVSHSRKLDKLKGCKIVPDVEISSLSMLIKAIEGLERASPR